MSDERRFREAPTGQLIEVRPGKRTKCHQIRQVSLWPTGFSRPSGRDDGSKNVPAVWSTAGDLDRHCLILHGVNEAMMADIKKTSVRRIALSTGDHPKVVAINILGEWVSLN